MMKNQLKEDWNAKRLKKWREEMEFSQAEAANQLGISREAYGKLERGINPIDRRTTLACKYLADRIE